MNVSTILNNSFFSNDDILIINSFILGLTNIKDIYHIKDTSSVEYLGIISNKDYYFKKDASNQKMYLQVQNGKNILIYNIYMNEFMLVYSGFTVKGELLGLGNKERKKINRKSFEVLYVDLKYKIFVIYKGNTKKINDIIIGIETYEVDDSYFNNVTSTYKKLSKIINYFNVEISTLSTLELPITSELKLEIFSNSKKRYSKTAAGIFLSIINVKELYNHSTSKKLKADLLNFISIYEMVSL